MPTDVIMPKVDMVMESGTILRWLRQENESVKAGEPLFEIETDKAAMEVEAPATGTLAAISAAEGDTIPVATRIALILAPGEAIPAQPALDAPAAQTPTASLFTPNNQPTTAPTSQHKRVRATPLARSLAKQRGLDLQTIAGSGPNGRIQKRDILAFQEAPPTTLQPAASSAPAEAAQPVGITNPGISSSSEPQPHIEGTLTPLTGVRKVVAERLAQSASIPQFVLTMDIDATNLLQLRERLPNRPSLTAILARAVAPLLLRHPALNSSFRDDGIWQHHSVHLGIAMDSDGRLLVPVIRDAQQRSLGELATQLGDLKQRSDARKLTPVELSGSTFSISNLGMFGIDQFTAIVNPPEAAILAVGRIAERGIGVGGVLTLKPMLTLSLSVDHRVTDGATAARFLAELRDTLEEPYRML